MKEATRVGVVAVTLALLFIGPGQVGAEESVDTVRTVRTQIGQIRDEVKKADPYPGSRRWVGRLDERTQQLEKLGSQPISLVPQGTGKLR